MKLAMEKIWETHAMASQQFDRHAPALVKTGARNIRHNLTTLYKKGKKTWKKQIWPYLEPHLGVPDAKAARKQKMKDRQEGTIFTNIMMISAVKEKVEEMALEQGIKNVKFTNCAGVKLPNIED